MRESEIDVTLEFLQRCITGLAFACLVFFAVGVFSHRMKFSIAQLLFLTAAFALIVAVAEEFFVAVLVVAASICVAVAAYPFAVLASPQKETYLDIQSSKFVRFLNSTILFGTVVLLAAAIFSFFS